jgi:hypothetical protein
VTDFGVLSNAEGMRATAHELAASVQKNFWTQERTEWPLHTSNRKHAAQGQQGGASK